MLPGPMDAPSDPAPARRAEGAVSPAARTLALLRRHGWNATGFQVLEPGFRYWFDGDDACVAYVDTGGAWVVAGAPIAPAARLAEVAAAFAAAAHAAGRRTAWFGTERRFGDATGWPALQVGEQPVWSPAAWPEVLRGSRSLREQLRRARAKGVAVRALTAAELADGHPMRAQLDRLIAAWQATRAIAPMTFLVQIELGSFATERRCFVAERAGAVVGVLGVVPIYARDAWFFEDFLRAPDAPNGTVELLVDAGMRAAADAGIALVTLGLAPLAGDVGRWLRRARRLGGPLYDFDGLRAFKAKFKPARWDPIYVAYPPAGHPIAAIYDSLAAFAGGGLVRFGLATLRRARGLVAAALAVIAVAVTALIAPPAVASATLVSTLAAALVWRPADPR